MFCFLPMFVDSSEDDEGYDCNKNPTNCGNQNQYDDKATTAGLFCWFTCNSHSLSRKTNLKLLVNQTFVNNLTIFWKTKLQYLLYTIIAKIPLISAIFANRSILNNSLLKFMSSLRQTNINLSFCEFFNEKMQSRLYIGNQTRRTMSTIIEPKMLALFCCCPPALYSTSI